MQITAKHREGGSNLLLFMAPAATELEVEIQCECGTVLPVVEVQDEGENKILAGVDPCPACMSEAKEKGRNE